MALFRSRIPDPAASTFGAVDRIRGIGEHDPNNNADLQGPRLRDLVEAYDWSSLNWETAERVLVADGSERQERTWLFQYAKAGRHFAGIRLGIG
jgi:hypothetical protein